MHKTLFPSLLVLYFLAACNLPRTTTPADLQPNPLFPGQGAGTDIQSGIPGFTPPLLNPDGITSPPTPDTPHKVPDIRSQNETYYVQPNDTLGVIAARFGVSVEAILAANQLADPNILYVGQALEIPAVIPGDPAPGFKIIPDSELVNGPVNVHFDIYAYLEARGGYINQYQEVVEGKMRSGPEIVDFIARNFSVNPRLLLAVLEYQTGWVSQPKGKIANLDYPVGLEDGYRQGLSRQLAWAADTLNRGYYLWQVDGLASFASREGRVIPVSPQVNAGTAAVQYLFAQLKNENDWRAALSPTGFYNSFHAMFGPPFAYALQPLVPAGLVQPAFQLPFEKGTAWTFTGGPHGGYGDGSAWAAIDFAPPMELLGCTSNDNWVTAMADGVIVRADAGAVVQDLDGDGFEETGWTILYMHVESRERVKVGDKLRAGDRIGHPSCEGGVSTGTHVHLARRYNGEWISADGPVAFSMDGWTAVGAGVYYDGYMQRGETIIEACECQDPENTIEK